jgi:hypothetical protein
MAHLLRSWLDDIALPSCAAPEVNVVNATWYGCHVTSGSACRIATDGRSSRHRALQQVPAIRLTGDRFRHAPAGELCGFLMRRESCCINVLRSGPAQAAWNAT